MKVVPILGVLVGEDGSCPPLPFLDLADDEARRLIDRGIVHEFDPAEEPVDPNPVPIPSGVTVPDNIPAPENAEPIVVEPAAEVHSDGTPTPEAERAQALADALDLLEPEHMVKTGPRAGKPSVSAVTEITGFAVTADEIDAAIAAQEVAA